MTTADKDSASDNGNPAYFSNPVRENTPGDITTVQYSSGNRLLIIARSSDLLLLFGLIPGSLQSFVLLTDKCSGELCNLLGQHHVPWLEKIENISIRGYLGNFRPEWHHGIHLTPKRVQIDFSSSRFDMILELSPFIISTPTLPPPGYFRLDSQNANTGDIIEHLHDWVGEFEKPKFFTFTAGLCAHQNSSITGCELCLSACATEAISSQSGHINIDPYICQGCGDCVSICPSGAIRYALPPPNRTLDSVRDAVFDFIECNAKPPIVIFCTSEPEDEWLQHLPGGSKDLVTLEIEALGSAGMEIWLATLAYGAAGILLLEDNETLPLTGTVLDRQLGFTQELLTAMGYDMLIRRVSSKEELLNETTRWLPTRLRNSATFSGIDDKRTIVRLSVGHLLEQSGSSSHAAPLSRNAPFGEIIVDTSVCTLCMSCVSVCPEAALTDRQDAPVLSFIEANCVQCGICEQACPENAITLNPRYLLDSTQSRKARLLNKEEPFCCIECNKPFATRTMIRTITKKLESHAMFQGKNKRSLMMCEDCRIRNQLDPDRG